MGKITDHFQRTVTPSFPGTFNSMIKLLRFGILQIALIYVSLLVIEAALFVTVSNAVTGETSRLNMHQHDETRGFGLIPNFKGQGSAVAGPYEIKVNAEGFRDIPWDFNKDFKVLVTGDSMTMGWGAPIEDGYVALARKAMKDKATFYNTGIGGYGVPNVLQTINELCPAIMPDHVFYMYVLNDLRSDNMRLDNFTVIDGLLFASYDGESGIKLDEDVIRRRWADWTPKKPAFDGTNFLKLKYMRSFSSERLIHPRQIIEKIIGLENLSEKYLRRYYMTNDEALYPASLVKIAAQQITEMKHTSEKCGARFSLFVLPFPNEGYYGHDGLKEPRTEALIKALAGSDVAIVDLRKEVKPGTKLWLDGDFHYNLKAATWVAEIMKRHLEDTWSKRLSNDAPQPGNIVK